MAAIKTRPQTIAIPTIVRGATLLTRAAPQPRNMRKYVPVSSATIYLNKAEKEEEVLLVVNTLLDFSDSKWSLK